MSSFLMPGLGMVPGLFRSGSPLDAAIANNLVAWWELDESSGSRLDQSLAARNLVETSGAVGSAAGKLNLGATGFSVLPRPFLKNTDAAFRFQSTDEFHLFTWINLANVAEEFIVSVWSFTTNDRVWFFRLAPSGDLEINVSDTGLFNAAYTASLPAPSLSTWHLVECVFKGSTPELKIAINNGAFNSGPAPTNLHDGPASLVIGGLTSDAGQTTLSTTALFTGVIDQTIFFDKEQPATVREEIWNSGSGRLFNPT